MTTPTTQTERNAAVVARFLEARPNDSLEQIGTEFRISRQRVHQILDRAGVGPADRRALRYQQLARAYQADKSASIASVARDHKVNIATVKKALRYCNVAQRPATKAKRSCYMCHRTEDETRFTPGSPYRCAECNASMSNEHYHRTRGGSAREELRHEQR